MDYLRLETAFDGGANGTKTFQDLSKEIRLGAACNAAQNLARRNPRG